LVVQTFEVQRGAILSLGFVIGRLLARDMRRRCVNTDGEVVEKMDTGYDVDHGLVKVISEAVKQIG